MKYLGTLFLIFSLSQAIAQDSFLSESSNLANQDLYTSHYLIKPNLSFLESTEGAKLISVRTTNTHFHKSYLINKNGETLSSGFMPSAYFSPNDNLIVISGQNTKQQDSFNPYGAYDMTSMIILSTFNGFISRIKINRR